MKSASSNKNKKTPAQEKTGAASLSDKPAIKSPNLFPVVGIGASAGGLDAFKKLLKAIPQDSGMAYVLVQHLDPNHESLLPEILQKVTNIPVLEITDDIKVQPDHIYVIPSNKMMVATDGVLLLAPRPEKSKTARNLPIDLFFTSLAEVHQDHAIGVVLSGTASDGTQGLKAIKEHGGITFAQDEASAEYEGMPHSAAQAGVVDFILPPGDIPKKLLEVTNKTILSDDELQNIPKQDEDVFKQILSLLRIRKGVDFTYYKQTTIRRRILRRMVVNKNEETGDYLKFLRGNTLEQDLLYQDMLIPVTSFFRDKKVFENLCKNVFPTIIKNKIPGDITRIWVAGCSTGQEVYSFAICFKEFLGDDHERIQIFGTDLSEPAIAKARTGIYDKSEFDAVTPERLKEHFTKNNGGYQVNKSIRDMCVFAHHNFLKDPPFGKMDCVSCRNVLIYMEPYLQKKALTTFHYALNPKGFLLLGKSESTGGVPDLFAAVEKNDKLYTRKDVPGRFMQVASQRSEQILSRPADSIKSETLRTDFQKTADDILLTKYTPAGVVVNETMDIVHFRGNTSNYLQQAPGKPSHNVLMMAKNGLGFELRNILHKAKTDKVPVVKENIPLSVNGTLRNISIEAVPLPNTLEPYYLILFHENNVTDPDGSVSRKKDLIKTKKDEKDIQIKLLERELAQAREDMRSITEDQEASNEELQSANEELLSGSEELQSLNEELETSKEELQSTNEELTVLNHELIGLNEQVTDARNYAESIVATLYQPLLVLDKHLRVKTANEAFYKTFKVNEQETEGVLIYDLGNRQWNIPELRTLLEEILPQKKQITDYEVTHNFLSIGQRIILLSALELTREKKEEKLILLSIEDITEKKGAAKKIEENGKQLQNIFLNAPAATAIYEGHEYKYILANKAYEKLTNRKAKDLLGKSFREVFPELKGTGTFELFDNIFKNGESFTAPEYAAMVDIRNDGILRQGYFNFSLEPLKNDSGEIYAIIAMTYDITEQIEARKKIEENEHRYHKVLMNSPFAFSIMKGKDMVVTLANDLMKDFWGKGQQVEGKTLLQVLPELIDQPFPAMIDKVYTSGEPVNANEILARLNRNGIMEDRYFNIVYQPHFEADKTISGVITIAHEVTNQVLARKLVEDSNKRYNMLLLQSQFAFAVLKGKDLVVTLANDSVKEMWGKGKEVEGKPLLEVLPELKDQPFPALLNEVYTTGIPYSSYESLVKLQRNGKMEDTYFNFTYQPYREADETISGVVIIATEVTPQAILNKKIKASEAFNSAVLESSPDCIKMMDEEGRLQFMNRNGICLLEIDDFKSVENTYWWDMWEPHNQQIIKDAVATAKSGEKIQLQLFGPTAKGTPKWWDIIVLPVQKDGSDKNLNRILSVSRDITEQKKAEEIIKESETRFRSIANASTAALWMSDENFQITYVNQTWIDWTGQPFEKHLGEGWLNALVTEDQEITREQVVKDFTARRNFKMDFRVKWTDGKIHWVASEGVPRYLANGQFAGYAGTCNDITERKQNELKEKLILTRFQNLVLQAPVAICVLRGEEYAIETINEGMCEMWDRTLEQALNKPVFDLLPELRDQGIKELLDNVYHKGERYVVQELSVNLMRKGKLESVFVKFVYEPLRDADGTISGVMALGHEITEQVVSRKKIEASETKFRTLIEDAPVATCFFTGREMKIEVANDKILGYWGKGNDIIGKTLADAVPELIGQHFFKILDDVFTTGKVHEGKNEVAQLKVNGVLGTYYFNYTYKPIRNAAGEVYGIMNMAVDVSEQVIAKNKNQETHQMHAKELEEKVQLRTLELNTANRQLQQKNQEISLSKYNKRFLTEFSEKFSAYKHNQFFNSLVQFIADTTILDYVFVGKLKNEGEGPLTVETIAITAMGKLIENISYALPDGPCERVTSGSLYTYPERCREIFPKNKTIEQFNVEGYIGYPLNDGNGKVMGLIAAMHSTAIEDVETVSSVLKIVAKRAEIELERINNEEILEKNNRELEQKNEELGQNNILLLQKSREVEDAREKLMSEYSRSLIEASLDPLITLSTEGKITDMNKATVHIMQQPREKITGTDFSGYFTEPQKAFEIYREVFVKGIVTNYPLTVKNNKLTEVLFNGSVYKDEQGKVLGAVIVARDITAQKRIEKELIEAKVLAEEEKSKAEKAAKSAEEAVISKQRFLSNMSHEIRTPMNAIIGFSSLVLKTALSAQQKEYLSAIKISGDTLIVLINDILDLAKVDAGKMTFEQIPFSMATNISAMLHLFETKTAELNIALVKEYDSNIPELLFGDPVRLHQIMLNLLSNAVKFTSKGKITVAVQLIKEEENNVTIQFTVKDTGIGIDENNLESIFENFQQASSGTSRLYGGTGLGLAIVKQLVEAQGGHIQVKSKPNQGAAFSFTLNFLKTSDIAALETGIMETDTETAIIKVLLVEDMALNQLLMKTVLEDFGFECDIAVNGKIAIEKLSVIDPFGNTAVYDVILMDLHMPEMNGFEATQFIRHTLKSDIPIIAITADVTTVDLAKCKAAGMNDYIAKPIDEKLLYSKIKGLVKNPLGIKSIAANGVDINKHKKTTVINLDYLMVRTKSNKLLMKEMIDLYLEQTPPIILSMKQSFKEKDWPLLYAAVHKLIPSFSIMGINKKYEIMADKVQEFARTPLQQEGIYELVLQLENICTQACAELKEELNRLKNN